jgi:hypothetical protein
MLLCRSIDNQIESNVVENASGLQTPQQTPRRVSDSATAATPAQTGRFLKSPLAPFHSVLSLLSKIATKDQTGSVNSKASVIYWDLFSCAAGKSTSEQAPSDSYWSCYISGAIAVLAKRIITARRIHLPPTPPMSNLDFLPQPTSPFSKQLAHDSEQATMGRTAASQATRASIDAKIREKLEKDRARQTVQGPLATPCAPGRTRTEQSVTPITVYKPMEAYQSRDQEEALAHLLIAAFEKTFGVRIDQRNGPPGIQAWLPSPWSVMPCASFKRQERRHKEKTKRGKIMIERDDVFVQ